MIQAEKLRLDKYLWVIRLFKTRSLAKEACEKGKVKFAGSPAKASKTVSVNDEYEIKTEVKRWLIKVTGLLHKRVKHEESLKYYHDITPADEIQGPRYQSTTFYSGKRNSRIGRPTKKERRDLDNFRDD